MIVVLIDDNDDCNIDRLLLNRDSLESVAIDMNDFIFLSINIYNINTSSLHFSQIGRYSRSSGGNK